MDFTFDDLLARVKDGSIPALYVGALVIWLAGVIVYVISKESFLFAKWLVLPAPLSGLAQSLMDLMDSSECQLRPDDDSMLLLGRKFMIDPRKPDQYRNKPKVCVYDPYYSSEGASCHVLQDVHLSKKEQKKIFAKARKVCVKLQKERGQQEAKNYCAMISSILTPPKPINESNKYALETKNGVLQHSYPQYIADKNIAGKNCTCPACQEWRKEHPKKS